MRALSSPARPLSISPRGWSATWRNGRGRALSLLAHPPAPEDDVILTTKVMLARAHLDHNPSNNRARNLKAYCQRCHMLHDREEHRPPATNCLSKEKCSGRSISRALS